MKQIGLIFFGLYITMATVGQTLNLQSGVSLSKLDWKIGGQNLAYYDQTLVGSTLFLGLDYLDNKFCNLSSNIGYIRKGGKEDITLIGVDDDLSETTITDIVSLDYISINTFIIIKYSISETTLPFLSIGPRFDYLISNSKNIDDLRAKDALNNAILGLILGGGVKFYLSHFEIGLRADYYLNFNKIADWSADIANPKGEISDNTYSINLTIGYILR